jgi:polyisoprenoid-binding protein YceI
MNITKKIVFIISLLILGYVYAATLLDTKKSSVTITAKQMNIPVEAKFNQVSGSVNYHPKTPEATQAKVDIDIASFDLGDPNYNKEVLKKDWFNAAQFPKASFISSAVKMGVNGAMNMSGKLTIKGKTVDVAFPVKIKQQESSTVFDGSLPIHRLAFHIGQGEWEDTSIVADEVTIQFHIVVTP